MYNFIEKTVNATNSGEAMTAMGIFAIVSVVCGLTVLIAMNYAYGRKTRFTKGVLYAFALIIGLTPVLWLIASGITMNALSDGHYNHYDIALTFAFIMLLNVKLSLIPHSFLKLTRQYKDEEEANRIQEEKHIAGLKKRKEELEAAKVARENLAKEVELAKIQADKEEMANLVATKLYERMKADKKVGIHSDTESTTE